MTKKFAAYTRLVAYVIVITWTITFAFTSFEANPDGLIPTMFVFSVGSYYGLAILLSAIALLPIFLIPKVRLILPFLIFTWLSFLLVDYLVFSVYKFHLDTLLLEMFFFDFSGMGIPRFLLIAFFLVALLLLIFSIFLQLASFKGGRAPTIFSVLVIVAVVPTFLVHSIISIWAHRYNRSEVTQYAAVLPAFFPVTSHKDGHRVSALFPELMPAEQGQSASELTAKAQGLISYPLEPIECSSERSDSILMIVLESWQADMLNPNIMPLTSAFSEKAFKFNQHISSGSTTIPGFFGLMFGLHPSYYPAFAASATKNPSEFTKTLGSEGYLTRVFTTGSLERFAMRTLIFPNFSNNDYRKYEEDQETVEAYIDDLSDQERVNRPTFDFLYLTSSHSPYRYPGEFEKFQPIPELVGSFVFNRMADGEPLKNRSRNSVYYLDSLIGQIIDELENQGALDNTWIVITGDHAEEFNESQLGYWGHGSNFSRWQTQVPLVVYRPSGESAVIERTSTHQDIVPTLLTEAVGCDTPTGLYSNGQSLFDLPKNRSTVMASYSFSAYWVDGVVYERESGNKYSWEDINQRVEGLNTEAIRQLWLEENQFRKTSIKPSQ